MADIQTLVNQVMDKAEKEEQEKFEAYEADVKEELQQAQANLDEEFANQKRHAENAETRRLQTQKQSYVNVLRNEKLQAKQSLLENVYQEAIVNLQQLSSEEFTGLIEGALAQLPALDNAILKVGEYSQHQFDSGQVQANNPQLQVGEEWLAKRSGFIISSEDVDYNFTFESIIEQKKATLAPELIKRAF